MMKQSSTSCKRRPEAFTSPKPRSSCEVGSEIKLTSCTPVSPALTPHASQRRAGLWVLFGLADVYKWTLPALVAAFSQLGDRIREGDVLSLKRDLHVAPIDLRSLSHSEPPVQRSISPPTALCVSHSPPIYRGLTVHLSYSPTPR